MSSAHWHPEFGYFCPARKTRRRLWTLLALLAVAAIIGAHGVGSIAEQGRDAVGVMLAHTHDASGVDAGRVPAGDATSVVAKTMPARETKSDAIRPAAVKPEAAKLDAGRPEAGKPEAGTAACEETTWSYLDGKCIAGNARKPRVVRVPTSRPAIAAVAIGRVAPSGDPPSDGRKAVAAASRPAQAAPAAPAETAAASAATDPSQPPAAATKKPQRVTQARRHDPAAASLRDARAPAGGVGRQAQFGFGGFFGVFR